MRAPALLVVVLFAALLAPSPAFASGNWLVPQVAPAHNLDQLPHDFRISPRTAIRLAMRSPKVRRELTAHPGLKPTVEIPVYTGEIRWAVGWARPGGDRLLEAHVDGQTGRVLEVWTGPQVDWLLARGYDPSVGGHTLNASYVWLPLCLLFLIPFFDPRRPFRLLHLDLLMLLGFGLSQIWLNKGRIDVSVPLVYPFLAYLLVRLLFAGFRPRRGRGPLIPVLPTAALAVGLVVLVAFRMGLDTAQPTVMDVGFASVIGAHRISHGEPLYVNNDVHGDTYGPITYIAYVPFEKLLPFTGSLQKLPAAQAAALTFDLLTILGLFLLGARLRTGREGKRLGLALAFAWTAYPYSTYVLQANTNDSLVAMLLVYALVALASPPARGIWLGLGAAAKFAPLALAPLFAAGHGDRRPGPVLRFVGPLVLVIVFSVFVYLPHGGLREFWDCTLGYQLNRESPFSIWGAYPSLGPLKTVLSLATLGLAASLFFVPRRRDTAQVAALAGAVVVSLQLIATHWFYFYLVWIAPLALVAFFAAHVDRSPERAAAGDLPEQAADPAPA